MYKFAENPFAGETAWNEWQSGYRNARNLLTESDKIRPMVTGLMEERVSSKFPMLNWFMSQGDVARLDPRAAKHRAMLNRGRFVPGTSASFYSSPEGGGLTNPFGIRNWFNNWGAGGQGKQVEDKIRSSSTLNALLDRYKRGHMTRSELQRLVPVDLKSVTRPTQMAAADAWRKYYRNQAAMSKIIPRRIEKAKQSTLPWAGVPRHILDPMSDIKRTSIGMKTSGQKLGAFDWLVNRGNRKFEAELERAIESPQSAKPFFTRVQDNLSGKKPSFWQRVNPLNWAEQSYLSDPRSQKFMRDRMAKRLTARDTIARLFPKRRGRASSLLRLMGPLGVGGAAAGLAGFATGNPWLGAAGLGGLGLQGYLQYRRAQDPNTWIRAFTEPKGPGGIKKRQADFQFLSDIGGLLHGKSASEFFKGEKVAGWFSAGGPKFSPITQQQKNDHALTLLRSHFPVSQGRKSISEATNMTFQEKLKLMNAYDTATAQDAGSTGYGVTTMQKVLPSLVGAGLGWVGASLAAPVFGFDEKSKKRLGIGSAALGAILNNPHLTSKVF